MTGFLQKIHDLTAARVEKSMQALPVSALRNAPLYQRQPRPVVPAFQNNDINIIAEVKFASPSQGVIHTKLTPVQVAGGYLRAGARMLSVLTEPLYFNGSLDYLRDIRLAYPDALLLRKDFIMHEYQLEEARACGADAVLLIAAMTEPALTKDLFEAAASLGLTVLLEVHDAAELDGALALGAQMVGVNNRNLKTLKIDLETSRALAAKKPQGSGFICESGLSTAADVMEMRHLNYDGFLMGTHFMRQDDPGASLQKFREDLSCA